MNATRVLLVDDEQAILDMISIVLRKEGFENIQTATTGTMGIYKCSTFDPEIIILDVMLPDMEGFEVCRQCREISQAPILFLTARSTDLDKLMGFGIGGDDYITKPFNPLEVVARMKANLRRVQPHDKEASNQKRVYDFGRFTLDELSGELTVNGVKVNCPAREFQMLLFLCKHPNRIFSRSQLFEQVWGEASLGDDNTVMVHIRRLREKIECDPGQPSYLITIRGLGYKLVSPQMED
ncbi:response regulator transcription factor [Neobacillus jeddahensis]|uniref:response regulator transcription factor n=1 Tax=Neobacillus jeddahensis TaxID=1461580 RepID=UPI00058E209E|nr:response regulator transcription factor [Neobacillus jeddahensis]